MKKHPKALCRLRVPVILILELWFNQTISIAFSLVYHIYFLCLRIQKNIEIMPQKLHLHTGVFRIHGFETKTFGTDNLYPVSYTHLDVYKRQMSQSVILLGIHRVS